MTQVLVNEASLQDIASAIREKSESTETYKPAQMGDAIRALKSGVDVNDAPKITFSGKWQKWFVEFYDGVPYWEAWFFSSGTLSITGSYKADAWGIGGGGAYFNDFCGGSGHTNMANGVTLSGDIAVTIGACGYYNGTYSQRKGGSTMLGSLLTCTGGGNGSASTYGAILGGSQGGYTESGNKYEAGYNGTPGDGHPMCRFRDPDKVGEAGRNTHNLYSGGNGWLHFHSGNNGEGYGAGLGANYTSATANTGGALVIRIPA